MWTAANRARMAAIEKTRRYPTDLTDEEWSQVEGLLPKPRKTGPRRGQMVLTAIRKRWPRIKHLFADSTYDRGKLMDKAAYLDFVIEIVRRKASLVQCSAATLGRRADLRLDDTMAAPRPRLRGSHRRVRSHDPCRHGRSSAPPYQPLTFSNGL